MLYFDYFESQIFWLLVTFLFLFFYIKLSFFPKVRRVFSLREKELLVIEKSIDKLHSEMQELMEKYTLIVKAEEKESKEMIKNVENAEKSKLTVAKVSMDQKFNDFLSSIKSMKKDVNYEDRVSSTIEMKKTIDQLIKNYEEGIKK